MAGASRIFSLASTTAVCPTLNRLGALVLQSVLCDGSGVAAAGVGVGVSADPAADVEVGATVVGVVVASAVGVSAEPDDVEVGSTVAASVGTEVGVNVGGRVADSTTDGIGDGTMVSVASGGTIVAVGVEGAGFVAHPRRSMRIRITTRMKVTIDLNRS